MNHHNPFSFFSSRPDATPRCAPPHAGGRHASGRGGRFGGFFGGGGGFGGGPFQGFFGGPPGQGSGFRSGRARRGDVRTALLLLLAEQPRNGYQLMQAIEQRSEGAWRPSPGSTYPALQQLEDEGLVRVEAEGGSRIFHLTAQGQEAAQDKAAQEPAPWTPANFGAAHNSGLRELFHQVAAATFQVSRVGTPAQVADARKILEGTRRALYRLLAEGDEDEG